MDHFNAEVGNGEVKDILVITVLVIGTLEVMHKWSFAKKKSLLSQIHCFDCQTEGYTLGNH